MGRPSALAVEWRVSSENIGLLQACREEDGYLSFQALVETTCSYKCFMEAVQRRSHRRQYGSDMPDASLLGTSSLPGSGPLLISLLGLSSALASGFASC